MSASHAFLFVYSRCCGQWKWNQFGWSHHVYATRNESRTHRQLCPSLLWSWCYTPVEQRYIALIPVTFLSEDFPFHFFILLRKTYFDLSLSRYSCIPLSQLQVCQQSPWSLWQLEWSDWRWHDRQKWRLWPVSFWRLLENRLKLRCCWWKPLQLWPMWCPCKC